MMKFRRWWCNYWHENAPRKIEVDLINVAYRQVCRRCGCIHPEFF